MIGYWVKTEHNYFCRKDEEGDKIAVVKKSQRGPWIGFILVKTSFGLGRDIVFRDPTFSNEDEAMFFIDVKMVDLGMVIENPLGLDS